MVPNSATQPSNPHPKAASSANTQAVRASGPMEAKLAPPMIAPAARHTAMPASAWTSRRWRKRMRPRTALIVQLRAAIGMMTPGFPAAAAPLSAMT